MMKACSYKLLMTVFSKDLTEVYVTAYNSLRIFNTYSNLNMNTSEKCTVVESLILTLKYLFLAQKNLLLQQVLSLILSWLPPVLTFQIEGFKNKFQLLS